MYSPPLGLSSQFSAGGVGNGQAASRNLIEQPRAFVPFTATSRPAIELVRCLLLSLASPRPTEAS